MSARPYLATKADLERQTRILVICLVATRATLSCVFVLGSLYIIERLPA